MKLHHPPTPTSLPRVAADQQAHGPTLVGLHEQNVVIDFDRVLLGLLLNDKPRLLLVKGPWLFGHPLHTEAPALSLLVVRGSADLVSLQQVPRTDERLRTGLGVLVVLGQQPRVPPGEDDKVSVLSQRVPYWTKPSMATSNKAKHL